MIQRINRVNETNTLFLTHSITWYSILLPWQSAFWKKKIKPFSCSSLILKQTICLDIRANVSRKQNKSRDFFRHANRSIALQSPYYMQIIRVKLFVLNENAAKHLHLLHLDTCQSPSRHKSSTPHEITLSVKISNPNKRDAKGKTDNRSEFIWSRWNHNAGHIVIRVYFWPWNAEI